MTMSMALPSGAVCISPAEFNLSEVRQDVIHYPVPFTELAVKTTDNIKLRKLLTNMLYVGVVAELLQISEQEIEHCIKQAI